MNPMAKVREGGERSGEVRHLRKELGREDDGRGGPVDEEVVPLDRGADPARQGDAPGFERSDRRSRLT